MKAVEILRDQTFLFTGLEKGVYRLTVASRLAKFQVYYCLLSLRRVREGAHHLTLDLVCPQHYSVEVNDASEDPVVYIFQWGVEKQPTDGRVSLSVTPLGSFS